MKGQILTYDALHAKGLILGENGNRYEFTGADWRGSNLPLANIEVDFIAADGCAQEVYPLTKSSGNADVSKRIIAALLGIFLGSFGAHKFFLGYKKQGIIMLAVWFFGLILFGLPSMVIGIIGFVEGILYLAKSDQEFDATYIRGQKPWF